MLGTLDFTVSEHWAPFNFPQSTALKLILKSPKIEVVQHKVNLKDELKVKNADTKQNGTLEINEMPIFIKIIIKKLYCQKCLFC